MGRPDCGQGVDVHFAIALPNRTTLPATREAGFIPIAESLIGRAKFSKPTIEQPRHMQLKIQRRKTRQLFLFTTNCSKLQSLDYLRIPSITLIFPVLS
jgi:hypothetical protein